MEPIALKKSCDFCTQSKVKCSGGYPCERCVTKGTQCFYSPRKKRGAPKKTKRARAGEEVKQGEAHSSNVIVTSSGFSSDIPLGSLADWERRSWSVFFTLYKHYGTSCSLHWFNRQLNKMKIYLEKQGNKDSLRRLTAWMEALSIDIDALAEQITQCHIRCFKTATMVPLKVEGEAKDPENKTSTLLKKTDKRDDSTPFIQMTVGYDPHMKDDVKVEANEAFAKVFGYSKDSIISQLEATGGGFLPWGGDILSRILTKEADLLAFVQILAIKFNSLGKPDFKKMSFPFVREVPSCHMFEVKIKESSNSKNVVPANCLVKCVHREHLSTEKAYLEINMEFSLMTPHNHLLTPEVKEETTTLKVDEQVTPFPARKNKRQAEGELEREASFDVSLLQQNSAEDIGPATSQSQSNDEYAFALPRDTSIDKELQKGYSSNSLLDNFSSTGGFVGDIGGESLRDEGNETMRLSQRNSISQEYEDENLNDQIQTLLDVDDLENDTQWFDELLGWAAPSTSKMGTV